MLIETTVIVLTSAVLFGMLGATWQSTRQFWIVIAAAIAANIAFIVTQEASNRSDLLTLWSLFFVGPLVLTVPWLRVEKVARSRILLGAVALISYVGSAVAWVTLAFNTGALRP